MSKSSQFTVPAVELQTNSKRPNPCC